MPSATRPTQSEFQITENTVATRRCPCRPKCSATLRPRPDADVRGVVEPCPALDVARTDPQDTGRHLRRHEAVVTPGHIAVIQAKKSSCPDAACRYNGMPRFRWKPTLVLVWAAVSLISAAVLLNGQRQGERALESRFGDRTQVAARFTETYTRDLLAQERSLARRELAGARVDARDFKRVVDLFGYEAAVLLDGRGRALHVAPAKANLAGKDLARKYAHLRSAVEGRPAVSDVVSSAAKGIPVVAFATPYGSKQGQRVFSGAFDVASTPIGAYLRNSTSLKGGRVYLLDPRGEVVASNRGLNGRGQIARADPGLARALRTPIATRTADDYVFASKPVDGTTWRLVMSVPAGVLFKPIKGFRRYVPWLLWAGFVLVGFGCALLVGNLISSRGKLHRANEDLDRLARIDSLTEVNNRRQIGETLDAAVANASRHEQALSLLMVDVDRFKAVNDNYGHAAGDEVLRFVARRLHESIRLGDLVGRWGGEEFLVVLPSTGPAEANLVAARLVAEVSSTPVVVGDEVLQVTVSVGVATRLEEAPDQLVALADRAMYTAKAAGGDRVASRKGATTRPRSRPRRSAPARSSPQLVPRDRGR